jgi:hypothetical protein
MQSEADTRLQFCPHQTEKHKEEEEEEEKEEEEKEEEEVEKEDEEKEEEKKMGWIVRCATFKMLHSIQ